MLLLHCKSGTVWEIIVYKRTVTVYVPLDNAVGDEDSELIAIAKSSHFFDEERDRIIKMDCQ